MSISRSNHEATLLFLSHACVIACHQRLFFITQHVEKFYTLNMFNLFLRGRLLASCLAARGFSGVLDHLASFLLIFSNR